MGRINLQNGKFFIRLEVELKNSPSCNLCMGSFLIVVADVYHHHNIAVLYNYHNMAVVYHHKIMANVYRYHTMTDVYCHHNIADVYRDDVHTVNLEDFQYIGTNITGFRIVNQSPEYQEIVQDWKSSHSTGKPVESEQTPYAKTDVALMYDAVWTFATALNTLEKGQRMRIKSISCDNEKPWSFGPTLANHIRGVELRGLTGRIVFDENGLRTNFTVKIQDLTHIGLTE
ncbi:glutamate receptor ionotropic, kainate 3, partial [Caerostris darwini]